MYTICSVEDTKCNVLKGMHKLYKGLAVIIFKCRSFLKVGQPRPLFCLFSFFSNTILQKHCRLQRDSNSGRQSRRRADWPLDHHHGLTMRIFLSKKCSLVKISSPNFTGFFKVIFASFPIMIYNIETIKAVPCQNPDSNYIFQFSSHVSAWGHISFGIWLSTHIHKKWDSDECAKKR